MVRVGRVGDIVMITAAIKAAIKLFEHAEIHLLTGTDGKRVIRGFDPRLSEVIIYNRASLLSFLKRKRIAKQIKEAGYSDIFCFETNPSYLKLFKGSGAIVHQMKDYRIENNYAQQCLQMVTEAAGKENFNEWIYLPVTEDGEQEARTIFSKQGITDDDFIVGLHPSFSGLRKLSFRSQTARHQRGWPRECFAKLAVLIHEYAQTNNQKVKIAIDLLAEEGELGLDIVEKSGDVIQLFTPKLNFERYKGTLKRYNLLVTPNTGPLHICAAVGTPVIGLFAGLKPENSGAYVDPARFTAVCAEQTEHPELGLAAITPEMVFEACKPYLSN